MRKFLPSNQGTLPQDNMTKSFVALFAAADCQSFSSAIRQLFTAVSEVSESYYCGADARQRDAIEIFDFFLDHLYPEACCENSSEDKVARTMIAKEHLLSSWKAPPVSAHTSISANAAIGVETAEASLLRNTNFKKRKRQQSTDGTTHAASTLNCPSDLPYCPVDGRLTNKFRCSRCEHDSETEETFRMLSLFAPSSEPYGGKQHDSVADAVKRRLLPAIGVSANVCPRCRSQGKHVQRQSLLAAPPPILALSLPRHDPKIYAVQAYDCAESRCPRQPGNIQVNDTIVFSKSGVCLGDEYEENISSCDMQESVIYDLHAMLIYRNDSDTQSLAHGHYSAVTVSGRSKYCKPKCWGVHLDDDHVSALDKKDATTVELLTHCRHLFYCRREQISQPQHIRFYD
eukprot:SAG31_NODE_130_length_23424_cov_45.648802_8_plen_401_part_00